MKTKEGAKYRFASNAPHSSSSCSNAALVTEPLRALIVALQASMGNDRHSFAYDSVLQGYSGPL